MSNISTMSTQNRDHQYWIAHALQLAVKAEMNSEVPVGAVLIEDNQIIGQGWNQPIACQDPTAHAEIIAIRAAANKLQNYRLPNTTLYVTLEPCAMCMGAIIQARIDHLIFGAYDPRAGAVKSVFSIAEETRLNHQVNWQGGVMAEECGQILQSFFRAKRIARKEQREAA